MPANRLDDADPNDIILNKAHCGDFATRGSSPGFHFNLQLRQKIVNPQRRGALARGHREVKILVAFQHLLHVVTAPSLPF